MSDTEKIVRELAEKWPALSDASCAYCRFVLPMGYDLPHGMPEVAPKNHAGGGDACLWARSRRWVAENPA